MVYTWLKFVHVLLAIVALGFNASYGIWLARAAREPQHRLHVLRGIKVLDDRFANPAYGLLLVTGLLMVLVSPLSVTTFWVSASLALYGLVVAGGLAVYTPTLRRQIRLLETEGGDSPEFRKLSARGRVVGMALATLVIVIVALMVLKPTLE